MATVREDWKMPEAPAESCPHCGREIIPVVYIDSGEGGCFFSCECGEDSDLRERQIDWPFGYDEKAYPADFEQLGFVIM